MSDHLAERLRDAVACGEFPKALALWEQFAQRLACEIERGTLQPGDMAVAGELVKQLTEVARASRAQVEEQLRESREAARASSAYRAGERRGPALLRKNL